MEGNYESSLMQVDLNMVVAMGNEWRKFLVVFIIYIYIYIYIYM